MVMGIANALSESVSLATSRRGKHEMVSPTYRYDLVLAFVQQALIHHSVPFGICILYF